MEYIDSGASKHIAPKKDFTSGSLKEVEGQGVRQADGTLLDAAYAGAWTLSNIKMVSHLTLEEVYLVPKLAIKLISVNALSLLTFHPCSYRDINYLISNVPMS